MCEAGVREDQIAVTANEQVRLTNELLAKMPEDQLEQLRVASLILNQRADFGLNGCLLLLLFFFESDEFALCNIEQVGKVPLLLLSAFKFEPLRHKAQIVVGEDLQALGKRGYLSQVVSHKVNTLSHQLLHLQVLC